MGSRPGAQPAPHHQLEVVPAEPRAGEEVTVRVVATDPDAQVTTNGGTYFFADPHHRGAQIGFPYTVESTPERFGSWTPPQPKASRLELSFAHTFSQPGTFQFLFEARSGDEADPGNLDRNPYANSEGATVDITVASVAAPADPTP